MYVIQLLLFVDFYCCFSVSVLYIHVAISFFMWIALYLSFFVLLFLADYEVSGLFIVKWSIVANSFFIQSLVEIMFIRNPPITSYNEIKIINSKQFKLYEYKRQVYITDGAVWRDVFFSRKSYISTKVYIYYLELCMKLKVCILHTFQKFDENIEIKIWRMSYNENP